jgi:ABC-type amino acid transport substrate-binding protein
LQVLERKTFSVIEGTSAIDWVVADIARLRLTATFAPLSRIDDDFRRVVDRALSGLYANREFGDIYAASFGPADPDTIQFFRMTAVPK